MVKFTQDTTPPTRDPAVQELHRFKQKTDPLLDGMPDTRQPLKPGDQYIGLLGELVTVLTPQAQAEKDARDREKYRAQLKAGVESDERCLADTRERIVIRGQELEDAAAALKALRPLKPEDATPGEVARRRAIRTAWVRACDVLESHLADEQGQLEGLAIDRARLKAA